jgi:hypothetical protein
MGILMRVSGVAIVSAVSFAEMVYIFQHLSITNFASGMMLILIFLLSFLLAFGSLLGNVAKYVSPLIGMGIMGFRLYELGIAQIEGTITNLISTYSGVDVVLSVAVAEIFIFLGFFIAFIGAIPAGKY